MEIICIEIIILEIANTNWYRLDSFHIKSHYIANINVLCQMLENILLKVC